MKNKKIEIIVFCIIFVILSVVMFFSIKRLFYLTEYSSKINMLLSDDVEIEKKWIINKNKIPFDLSKAEKTEIQQTYICFSPEIRVRKLNGGAEHTFTVKANMTSNGLTRDEYEKEITKEEYDNLIQKKEGNTIYKTRYQFLDNGYVLAIDIFSGDLEGLAYLEIEFENEEQASKYKTPNWVTKDVTGDINYKNGHLARYGIPSSFYEYMK